MTRIDRADAPRRQWLRGIGMATAGIFAAITVDAAQRRGSGRGGEENEDEVAPRRTSCGI